MSKKLVIVESPAKAKTIEKYLGPDYIVRASKGHIKDLAIFKTNIGVDIDNGFAPKYVIIDEKKDTVKGLIAAAGGVEEILLASDPDREGEAIAWHLADILKDKNVPIKRVFFHEITKKGVQKGIANPTILNENLYDAQQARRVLDRLVGFLVSPYLMNKVGPKLSAGRVQSVAVRMIVDREREIENFKPEEYWNILAALGKQKSPQDCFIAKYSGKITEGETANKIKKDLEKDSFIISELEEKEKKRNPYPPFITSSLAASAAGRYKFAAARTMKAAQALYESGLITYMRTDSVRISPDAIDACRDWLSQNNYDVPNKPNVYATKNSAQDAHEGIRPTDILKLPKNIYLSEDEQKIYKLIWERFVASQMNPALYDTVSVTVTSSSNHILKANGRVLKYKGWLEISGDLDNDDDGETKLPLLKKNEQLILVPPKVKSEQKFTQPPPRYSEKTLIKELEKKGIGRPSTYATIMSKITDRNYVDKKADMFIATELGKKVIDKLVGIFKFMEYEYTANMEEKLDKIASGDLKYIAMMTDFYTPFETELRKAYKKEIIITEFKCDLCQSFMHLRKSNYGIFLGCGNYPNCKFTAKCEMEDGKPVLLKVKTASNINCPNCNAAMVQKNGKYGPFYACTTFPKCNGQLSIAFGKCKKCQNKMLIKAFDRELKLACSGYPSCRNVEEVPENCPIKWTYPDVKPRITTTVAKVLKRKKSEPDEK